MAEARDGVSQRTLASEARDGASQRTLASEADGRARRYWTSTTSIAAALCIVGFVLEQFVGADALWFRRGDETTEPWRLVTSAFAHAGLVHLLGDMILLVAIGMTIDLRLGRARTAVILGASAFAGSLLETRVTQIPTLGVTGACFGALGAMLAVMPRRRQLFYVSSVPIPMPMSLWVLAVMAVFTFTAWVDLRDHLPWFANAAGFVTGCLVALPMRGVRPSPWFELADARHREVLARIANPIAPEAKP